MRKIVWGLVIALGVMTSTTGCVRTFGNANINDRKTTNKIRRGYTKAQVRGILGNPASTMVLNDGERWSYSYAEVKLNYASNMVQAVTLGLGGGEMASDRKNTIFIIKFNRSGRVVSKRYGY